MPINEHTLEELSFYFYSAEAISGLQSNFSAAIEVINANPTSDKNWFVKGFTGSNKFTDLPLINSIPDISRLRLVRSKLLQLTPNDRTTIALAHDDSLPYHFRKTYTDSPYCLAGLVERTPTALQEALQLDITPRAVCFSHRIRNPLNAHDRNLLEQIIQEAKSTLISALTNYEAIIPPKKRKSKSDTITNLLNQLKDIKWQSTKPSKG